MSGAVQLAYLVATALFVFSLHWMNDPKTARRGVGAGVAAMALAVLATWSLPEVVNHLWIVAAIAAGQDALLAEGTAVRADGSSLIRAAAFTDLLVARLNTLVSGNLVADSRFRDLREHAGVVDADNAETRRPRHESSDLSGTRFLNKGRLRFPVRVHPTSRTPLCHR